jgi:ketosteroid isomerase-like protein
VADQTRRTLFANVLIVVAFLLSPATLALCGVGQSVNVEATVAAGVAATQQAAVNLQATVAAAVAATQAASPAQPTPPPALSPPAPSTPAAPAPSDPEVVRTVILIEANAAIAKDLAVLKSIYAPDAVVIDHNGTPDDPGDDTTWQGWVNIERRYMAFFSAGNSSLTPVDLSIQMDNDSQATATHRGVMLNGTVYPDRGVYTLNKINGQWLISRLEYGNEKGYSPLPAQVEGTPPAQEPRDDGLYELKVGNQHRYEEPWGWDRGDPCKAWETGDFDDTRPNYRGFNVELLLTNNSEGPVPDAWPINFTTAKGKSVQACYYGYAGSGPAPGATGSVTFFTVVEKGDYVEKITFSLNDQTVQLCLDGKGGWSSC